MLLALKRKPEYCPRSTADCTRHATVLLLVMPGYLTRCTMMQEPELPMRPLQNHLPVEMHFTTHAGLCTPQYLQMTMIQYHYVRHGLGCVLAMSNAHAGLGLLWRLL